MAATDDGAHVSRIFIKGLPPTITDADLKKHFSQNGKLELTDAKLFNHRRIGYVGYRRPEDARLAVKYFNKSFIRMSRVGVELAQPYLGQREQAGPRGAPIARSLETMNGLDKGEDDVREKGSTTETDDAKLNEFMEAMKPQSKKRRAWEAEVDSVATKQSVEVRNQEEQHQERQSDEEYEVVPQQASKRQKKNDEQVEAGAETQSRDPVALEERTLDNRNEGDREAETFASADADWMRNRTSRLLGLLDDDEEEGAVRKTTVEASDSDDPSVDDVRLGDNKNLDEYDHVSKEAHVEVSLPSPRSDDLNQSTSVDKDIEAARSTMRLFLRNLAYETKAEDLEAEFAAFGNVEEVHVPRDHKTGRAKGFAYIQFGDPDSAENALCNKDGTTFQGRLLHVLPAAAKRESKLDDYELSKLPLKKQQLIRKRREAASTSFNWNALYLNADAVVSSVADRLGIAKSEVLDPTSSDAAVKQAQAETHVIQETKSFFSTHGVDLDSFKKSQKGDTAILAKNIPFDCSRDELKRLFEQHGDIKRFLMPSSGVIAIVEFANAAQCRTAYAALAYRRIKSSMLFLEKAPRDLFAADTSASNTATEPGGVEGKLSTAELKESDAVLPDDSGATATLFIRNLNFSTTNATLTECFKPLEGFLSARVKTKTDPKKPGQVLSMGFGFAEFRSAHQAQAALKVMDGHPLEGHKLQVRASHKGADAAEERRRADTAKKSAAKHTKVVIKNLPFEATKKDVRALFGSYGQLRSVRVPKKMDRGARGFAFADFTTPKEAESAIQALKDTHLLGRRLVLDFADEAPEDAEKEIEKMQEKMGMQVNRVALQKLTSGGRKKFSTQQDQEE